MIRGLEGVVRRLSAASRLERAVSGELAGIARDTMEKAREMAPVGEGPRSEKRLVDSFSYEAAGLKAIAKVENPHAAYVEFGTGRRGAASGAGSDYDEGWPGMAAQPYMYPAACIARESFSERMAAVVMAELTGRR